MGWVRRLMRSFWLGDGLGPGVDLGRRGNISVRLDADRLLVTPGGARKDELEPEDLVVVWHGHPDREAVSRNGRRPTSDLAIHLAVHAARPDIGSFAHAHLPSAMGLTLAGEVPDPATLPETALLLPRLPYVGLGVPGSGELAARIAAALTEPPEPFASAALLERHGAVAVGRDPAGAVDRLELVEVLCRTWREALLIRAARVAVGIVDETLTRTRVTTDGGIMNARKYLAELLGTFLFMMVGYMSVPALHAAAPAAPNILVVPFSFGLGLMAAIFAFGSISGGHFNPAVTVAMMLDRRTLPVEGVAYIVAQIIGAIAAAIVVMLTVSQTAVADGITKPGTGISDVSALVLETIFTAIFLTVILVVSKRNAAMAALAIPLTLVAIHFAIATITGSSVNPARSIGSAVVGGDLSQLWIYLIGPTIGGIIGYGIYKVMDGGADEPLA